jgi:hypothetical protein
MGSDSHQQHHSAVFCSSLLNDVKFKTQPVYEGKLQSFHRNVLRAETVFPQQNVLLENADVKTGVLASELFSNFLTLCKVCLQYFALVNVRFTLEEAMKVQRGITGIALLFL